MNEKKYLDLNGLTEVCLHIKGLIEELDQRLESVEGFVSSINQSGYDVFLVEKET